jgi:hypothetical protein
MELDEIISTWYKLASGGNVALEENSNVFFKFIAVWVAFNALYASKYSSESGDRDQVIRFAGEPLIIDRHRQLAKDDADYLEAANILKERGVGNLRGGGTRKISSVNNLNDVMLCVYQVRCNLFHGGKAPGNARDERLVGASYTITSKLIASSVRAAL